VGRLLIASDSALKLLGFESPGGRIGRVFHVDVKETEDPRRLRDAISDPKNQVPLHVDLSELRPKDPTTNKVFLYVTASLIGKYFVSCTSTLFTDYLSLYVLSN
jgi:hypothetical protein